MTDLEKRLELALKADDPAPRDPMFRIDLMVRRERAEFRRQAAIAAAMALGAALLALLGLAAASKHFDDAPGRLAMAATSGLALTAIVAWPHLGILRGFALGWRAKAASALQRFDPWL